MCCSKSSVCLFRKSWILFSSQRIYVKPPFRSDGNHSTDHFPPFACHFFAHNNAIRNQLNQMNRFQLFNEWQRKKNTTHSPVSRPPPDQLVLTGLTYISRFVAQQFPPWWPFRHIISHLLPSSCLNHVTTTDDSITFLSFLHGIICIARVTLRATFFFGVHSPRRTFRICTKFYLLKQQQEK